jgi:glycosyltransferase involved in cell wall biosynthesis
MNTQLTNSQNNVIGKHKSTVKIICLTPVRNEAWVLDKFLQCTSLWADHIIIADQMSTDGSREIARKYSKVILVDNISDTFNEPERQKLLIEEARKIPGPRLLITLDADEIFTPNIFTSPEWHTILTANLGTIFKFQWANFKPDLKNMWLGDHFAWGYLDDGYHHSSTAMIHNGRIPLPLMNDIVILNQIKVIHLQYTNWERMQSKHRWYQTFEIINFPGKSALKIFRMYHHMFGLPKNEIIPIPDEWFSGYTSLGIDLTSVLTQPMNYFDEQCLQLFEQYGGDKFKKLNIWDLNWVEKAELYGKTNLNLYVDPRSKLDKFIQKYLIKTQSLRHHLGIRFIDFLIRIGLNY